MALETVVYPKDPLSYGCNKDLYSLGGSWGYEFWVQEEDKAILGTVDDHIDHQAHVHANWDCSSPPRAFQTVKDQWDPNSSSPEPCSVDQPLPPEEPLFQLPPMETPPATATATGRRKRRRTRTSKNKEEIENQRMTHIVVERNRRKQMNDYLAILRSLMPPSYVQRVSTIFSSF